MIYELIVNWWKARHTYWATLFKGKVDLWTKIECLAAMWVGASDPLPTNKDLIMTSSETLSQGRGSVMTWQSNDKLQLKFCNFFTDQFVLCYCYSFLNYKVHCNVFLFQNSWDSQHCRLFNMALILFYSIQHKMWPRSYDLT